jgi:Na+-transporting methylmalonyl-CoA/oxaloacetate decarboxylase gamma subunit
MNIEIVKQALEVMGKGMLSIFVVIFILTLIVMLLAWVTNLKIFKKNEQESDGE